MMTWERGGDMRTARAYSYLVKVHSRSNQKKNNNRRLEKRRIRRSSSDPEFSPDRCSAKKRERTELEARKEYSSRIRSCLHRKPTLWRNGKTTEKTARIWGVIRGTGCGRAPSGKTGKKNIPSGGKCRRQ